MFKKITLIIAFISSTSFVSAQHDLNAYKYVIVPAAYDFQHEADEYQLNSLSKFLFEKYGFVAVMDNESLPDEILSNGCLALKSDVIKQPGLLNTKLQIELRNCKNDVVYLSREGQSREKKYNVAYNKALRDAFTSFETLNHVYEPSKALISAATTATNNSNQKEIKRLQEEIQTLKREKEVEVVTKTPIESPKPKGVESPKENVTFTYSAKLKKEGVFAYDLIDSKGQIAYTILFSGKEDVYIVKDTNAIIYKLNGQWVMAKSKADNSLEVKAIAITF